MVKVLELQLQQVIPTNIQQLDLFAFQRTLKSLLQQHSLNESVACGQPSLWSNFHIHTRLLGKIIAFAIWTFVGKAMALLFNMLCKFVIAFLPSIF